MAAKKNMSRTIKDLAKGNSISKVCAVLMALTHKPSLRLNEISDLTGLNRVTALRILEELTATGFIGREESPPRYNFGPEVVAMSAAAARSFNLRDLVRPSLLRLAEMSGDTLLLHVRSGAEAIVVDRVIGSFPIRANFLDIGSRRPLGIGGGSMALLSGLPADERDAILDITCTRIDEYDLIDREVLLTHIDKAQAAGYVLMYDIVIAKMAAIGYPIKDAHGQIVGSISIVALSDRIAERETALIEAMAEEVRGIERQL